MNKGDQFPLLVSVQSEDFNAAAEISRLTVHSRNIGAVVTFSGLCRDESGKLAALELEHYPGMAEAQIRKIARQAISRWPLLGLTVIHRFGLIQTGENIVLVATSSSHRQAAFDAANFLMDFLKTDAPFWKREHLIDGSIGPWVDAKSIDDETKKRWQE